MLQIHAIESMPFAENSYIVWRTGQREAFVIDPGFEPELILDFLKAKSLVVVGIVNTHGHVDHIAGNAALKEAFPEAPILIGEHEAEFLTDAQVNMSAKYGVAVVSPPADRLVKDGETITVAGIALDVREIPGHSPGHVCFHDRGGRISAGIVSHWVDLHHVVSDNNFARGDVRSRQEYQG